MDLQEPVKLLAWINQREEEEDARRPNGWSGFAINVQGINQLLVKDLF